MNISTLRRLASKQGYNAHESAGDIALIDRATNAVHHVGSLDEVHRFLLEPVTLVPAASPCHRQM